MPWIVKTLLSVTALYLTSVAVAEENDSLADCADFNNATSRDFGRRDVKLYVQYLLLTRRNLDCATPFSYFSLNDTLQPSLFNVSLPTKVIIHGYRVLGSKPSWVKMLAQALLQSEEANVVVVDWVYGASFAYNLVVENYKEVAVQVSVLIYHLQRHGCKLEDFHFIGVSLGAHVSGFVGTLFEGKLGRITGLDPAGPMFKGADTTDRLDPSDALFVEAIHTDSDHFGISIPVGHVDFFLNGGMDQTGCARSRFSSILVYFPVYGYMICDHMRAIHVYISVLNGSCPLIGLPCSSYEDFLAGRCLHCQGICPRIGTTVSPPPVQEQKLFLLTSSAPPFCAHHILVELEVSPLDKSAEVEVTLRTEGLPETAQRLRFQTQDTIYRRVIAHAVPLCEIHSILLKNTGFRYLRQGNIHFVSVCISEFPHARRKDRLCVKNVYLGRASPWSHDYVQVC